MNEQLLLTHAMVSRRIQTQVKGSYVLGTRLYLVCRPGGIALFNGSCILLTPTLPKSFEGHLFTDAVFLIIRTALISRIQANLEHPWYR